MLVWKTLGPGEPRKWMSTLSEWIEEFQNQNSIVPKIVAGNGRTLWLMDQ